MNYGRMPKGKYWVGDLCYVMHPQWTEACSLFYPPGQDNYRGNQGVFKLANGVRFALFSTAFGDGTYLDREGREYPVDAGSIGCIRVEDIADTTESLWMDGGNIVDFEYDFEVGSNGSELRVGNVWIDTDPPYEEDEYDYDEEEAQLRPRLKGLTSW